MVEHFDCMHRREDGICKKGASSSGKCIAACSHYETNSPKIMRVRAVWEFEVDISDFDPKFVDIEGLAKDLTRIELADQLKNNEIYAEDFDYEVARD